MEGSVTEYVLGNILQTQLNIRALFDVVVKRLSAITSHIRTGVLSRSTRIVLNLYKTMMRPLLESI